MMFPMRHPAFSFVRVWWIAAALLIFAACSETRPPSPDAVLAPGAQPVFEGDIGAGEGPVWHPAGDLYFTGGGRITKRDSQGNVTVFREPSGGANGLLFDLEGRLVACEGRSRRVTRTEHDGSITVLADNYQGMQFNAPNDLTIDSKGRIYFTDPRYGNRDSMEMKDEEGRLVEGAYRIDAPGQVTRIITHEVDRPNGILVSAGDKFLYVADNNNNNVGAARKLWRFRLTPEGAVDPASRTLIFDWEQGRGPDGLEMDEQGRLYVAGGLNEPNPPYETADRFKGGVYILSPEGKLLEFVHIPRDEVTNVAFGGSDLKMLYITAGGSLWSIRVTTPGLVPYTGR
jgi:gluconolactonase